MLSLELEIVVHYFLFAFSGLARASHCCSDHHCACGLVHFRFILLQDHVSMDNLHAWGWQDDRMTVQARLLQNGGEQTGSWPTGALSKTTVSHTYTHWLSQHLFEPNLHYLCTACTAPYHSFWNPAERGISVLNLGLQSVGLAHNTVNDTDIKDAVTKCNSIWDTWELAEDNSAWFNILVLPTQHGLIL